MNGEVSFFIMDKESGQLKQIEAAKPVSLQFDPAPEGADMSVNGDLSCNWEMRPTHKSCRQIKAIAKNAPKKPRLPRKQKKKLKKFLFAMALHSAQAASLASALDKLRASLMKYPPGGYVPKQ